MVNNQDAAGRDEPLTDTEQRILNAAVKVFMVRGKAGTTMQDIAGEAGINRSLLHYYFRSKDRLFDKVFENLLKSVFPMLASILLSDLTLLKKIELLTEKYVDLLKDKPYLPFFILQEITRNPERMMSMINIAGTDRINAIEALGKQLSDEGISVADPRHFIANFIGMVIFPFVARPLFIRLGFDNNREAYDHFLEERKSEIPRFFRMAMGEENNKPN